MTEQQIVIREATLEDLNNYILLSKEFHNASPMRSISAFQPKEFKEFLVNSLSNPNMAIILAELGGKVVGITGALIYPLYFSPSTLVAQELWWWLTPDARGSGAGRGMYDYIEKWSKDNGASAVFMIALEDDRVDKMAKLYKRYGYTGLERTFLKEI